VAILRTVKHPYQTATVIEDPTPGSRYIFFQNDAYNKETLTPLFDIATNHNSAGGAIDGIGRSSPATADDIQSGSWTTALFLNGPTVDIQHNITSNNTWRITVDPQLMASMDPNRPIRQMRYDSNGITSLLAFFWNKPWGQGYHFIFRINPADLASSAPFIYSAFQQYQMNYPVYYNPSTANMVCLHQPGAGTNFYSHTARHGFRIRNYLSAGQVFEGHSTTANNKSQQFIGVATDGRALFLWTDYTGDYDHQVIKYSDSDNTSTLLFNNSTAPTAAGTSAGGNRSTNFGGNIPKYASTTFTDPNNSSIRGWYIPYLDSTGKYHPFYFQWNTTNDAITRNADITVNWGATNQDAIWSPDNQSAGSVNALHGGQRMWFNETFIASGNRYLMFFQLHGGTAYDVFEKMRTFMVFTTNPSQPKTLTYHSSVTIPATPKNIIWLNDAKTQLGVITHNQFLIYAFNPVGGWGLTNTLSFQFWSVGRDSLGRIWAVDVGSNGYYRTHLITLNVPVSITVTSTATTYNYTGANVNSTVSVNAYDPSGARIAVPVKLIIDGGSMTFSGANLTTNVTTSNSTDTSVPIVITGGGVANIIASVVL